MEAADEVAVETAAAAVEDTAGVVAVEVVMAGLALVGPCRGFLLGALLRAFLGTTTGLDTPSWMFINRIQKSNAINLFSIVNCQGIGAHFPGTGCAIPSNHAVCAISLIVPSLG